jgi:hypothetical protein
MLENRVISTAGVQAFLSKDPARKKIEDAMANYKRRRPRNGGCLFCKPQKMNGQKATIRNTIAEQRSDLKSADDE